MLAALILQFRDNDPVQLTGEPYFVGITFLGVKNKSYLIHTKLNGTKFIITQGYH